MDMNVRASKAKASDPIDDFIVIRIKGVNDEEGR